MKGNQSELLGSKIKSLSRAEVQSENQNENEFIEPL